MGDADLKSLTPQQLAVVEAVRRLKKLNFPAPSLATLAQLCKMSRNALNATCDELVTAGVLEKRNGRAGGVFLTAKAKAA